MGNIRLIVGLGNPGPEYDGSRHNIGFSVIERFLAKLPKGFEKKHGHSSFYWFGTYAGKPLFLQKPMTFMNLSGEAVGPLARAEKIAPEEILIIQDDMDLPLGKLRIRRDGSSGGHNGIKSLIDHLGTEKFPRIRVGIGRAAGNRNAADFVLSGFDAADADLYSKVLDGVVDAMILILRRDLTTAMNQYNGKDFAADSAAETESGKENK